jgi:hypothetical protein
MSYTTVGHCPKCGAPIYAPLVWQGITPPPSEKTCQCYPEQKAWTSTGTSNPPPMYTENICKDVPDWTYGNAERFAYVSEKYIHGDSHD